ncbi:CD225/dispanin family protein [Mesohalobacter halotolerans]|uniref:CD225/dispanin family protein n=1 Tax=Mesohalobacter halotolerans TaxID=1883405 RepID=A0A4U5TTW0_9FLAO|nr:CD225/dispanin family protein [Mesohalobacter halotolerans]MBS3738494.1 CD225/dispanin family protein [Psychroflexus sp.]TKS57593.1 CD225/dispanin family protein [Mesohalobacter halotolerans]
MEETNQVQQPKPPNYLALAILSTIFCCLPLGIVSIVFSTQVNSKYAAGDYDGALKASKNAKLFWILAAVIGVVVAIIYFSVVGFTVFEMIESGEFNPEDFQ